MPNRRLVFPAPSIVVGLGRFGLAVLERLGEDRRQLKISGADPSINNLRLLYAAPAEQEERCWRRQEQLKLKVAHHVRDGDVPSLVLDFVLLRAMGLVRYRSGGYQVAIPRDRGAIRVSDILSDGPQADPADPSRDRNEDERLVRRRFFDWFTLDTDPLIAAEKLRRKAENDSSFHLFIVPIISRIRQGHSPTVLMSLVLRCQALVEGRDPSPWRWVRSCLEGNETKHAKGWALDKKVINQARHRRRRLDGLLNNVTQPPLKLRKTPVSEADDWEFEANEIFVPAAHVPRPTDPEAPIDPFYLLGEDWEASGWATESEEDQRPFRALKVSHFRLGLFDHSDPDLDSPKALEQTFKERLVKLGKLLHRGLVGLWVDLKREQVQENTPIARSLHQGVLDDAVGQSLDLLEQLLISPLENESLPELEALVESLKSPQELPLEPTRFLRSLRLDPDLRRQKETALERRLEALGLADEGRRSPAPRLLLSRVDLSVEEYRYESRGRRALRKILNQEARELLDFSFLASYRRRPTRTPPRLTVFVIADMSEPFARLKTTDVLRDVHSELLRAFSSIFELHREGFDRALSVVPILWMPHPADPFEGEPLEQTRLEEAVVIDAIHEVRRWVEAVMPGARRRISQIFINGRVTDNAVLKPQDCVQQTRDFLSFFLRNDLARDDSLRRTAVGPGGDDYFASFACCEIEFPAERAREYLANRLIRDCIHHLRVGKPQQETVGGESSKKVSVPEASSEEKLVQQAVGGIQAETEARAESLGEMVDNAVGPLVGSRRCMPQHEILQAFDQQFEDRLWGQIFRLWGRLTQERGRVDDLVDRLRRQVSRELRAALPEIRQEADTAIETLSRLGLHAVMARLGDRRREAFSHLQDTEAQRRRLEAACQRNPRPEKGPLTLARERLLQVARRKPDCGPQRVGLLAWALATPGTAAVVGASMAAQLGSGLAWCIAALILVVAAGGLMFFNTISANRKLMTEVAELRQEAMRLVAGEQGDLETQRPSLRSFFESRLRLTASLARRTYALHSFEQSAVDEALGRRLRESIDIQEHNMMRCAEDLRVQPASSSSEGRDNLKDLFVRRGGETMDKLIDSEHLLDYYRSRTSPKDVPPAIELLRAAGGLRDWRRTACLSNTEEVVAFGRRHFSSVVLRPITELDYFSDSVGEHLLNFARKNYSTLGFGAKFLGYEGLDPDGLRISADATLVADQPLIAAYKKAEEHAEEEAEKNLRPHSRPRTLECQSYQVRSNAAYMLSMVQGVRAHSVRNLKRFESFHDRSDEQSARSTAVRSLTGFEMLGSSLLRDIRSSDEAGSGPPGEDAEAEEKRGA